MTRWLASAALSGLLLCFGVGAGSAQDYPNRSIRVLVGFAAGGTVDAITRIYASKLSERLGQQIVVENVPGGGSHIVSTTASRAQPDGYTLLIATNANTTGVSLYEKLNYRFPDDFEAVGLFAGAPSALVASPAAGVNSVRELIAAAKAKPGEITYGSAGVGTATHMAAEWFQMATGTKFTHVPYKALGGAMADLMGGRLSILFSPLGTVSGAIKNGQLKGLAITTAERSKFAPDLPTIIEGGVPDLDIRLWVGLVAPKGTPKAVTERLVKALAEVQKDEDLIKRLAGAGAEPRVSLGPDFEAFMRKDVNVWAEVVKFAGVKIK